MAYHCCTTDCFRAGRCVTYTTPSAVTPWPTFLWRPDYEPRHLREEEDVD